METIEGTKVREIIRSFEERHGIESKLESVERDEALYEAIKRDEEKEEEKDRS